MTRKGEVIYAQVSVKGVEYEIGAQGQITFIVPVVQDLHYNGPLIDREVSQWASDNKIPESVFSDAYDAAVSAFYAELNKGMVFSVLKGNMEVEMHEA